MTPERRAELRRNSEQMLQSTAASAPYDISPAEVLELLDAAQDEMYLRGNQLAAISTILMADTPVTLVATRLPKDHALYTVAFQDAVRAVEKIIRLRGTLEQLERDADPAVCRLQFPDGTVPSNAHEAAECWKQRYDESADTVRRIWMALGISNYVDANGLSIVEHVANLNEGLELHRRYHSKVGCPGEECYVCNWELEQEPIMQSTGIPHGDPAGEGEVGSDDPAGKPLPLTLHEDGTFERMDEPA